MPRALVVAALTSAALVRATEARADEPLRPSAPLASPTPIAPAATPPTDEATARWTTPSPAPRSDRAPMLADPVAVTGIASLALGGLLIAIGAPVWATSRPSERICGKIAGCFDSIDVDIGARDAGTTLTGAGIGFVVAGGLTTLVVAASPKSVTDRRTNGVVASIGLGFAGLSLGSFLGGILLATAAEADGGSDAYGNAWPHFVTAGVSALVGIPMLAAGASFTTPQDRARRRLSRSAPHPLIPTRVGVGPGSIGAAWAF